MHRVLAAGGVDEAPVSDAVAIDLYRDMVRARRFDERALSLQRRGWMSGYPPFRGQEASQVGAAHAMADDDWLFPTYRSNAMLIALGVDMVDILLFRRGYSEFHRDGARDQPIFPQAVPIATQIPHATGVGMAVRYTGDDHAVVCYLGDGATSEGDFHEGLNFAGVFETPTLFFCENNHWAISVPMGQQTAAETIAQKATAYGFDGTRVDGMDPLAVYDHVGTALKSVREGTPHLVESLTYRHGAHTTADDPSRYRSDEGIEPWRLEDPIERYETALVEAGYLDDETIEAVDQAARDELAAAVETAEAIPPPPADDVFAHLFASLPPRQRDQDASMQRNAARDL